MFKNMKLGTKIALGFGLLIVLTCLLGGLAVINMKKAQAQSNLLAYEYVPEVDLASNVSLYAQKTMYGMRGYALSEEEAYLADAQKNLAETKKWIGECETLGEKSKHLTKLKDAVQVCTQSMAQYEQLANKTVEENRGIAQNRQKLDAAALELAKNTSAFLASQNEAFQKDLAERQQKIRFITDLVNTGTDVRALSLKSQTHGKPEIMEQAVAQLDGVNSTMAQLRLLTEDNTEETQKVEQTDKAVKTYRNALTACLTEQKKGTGADQAQLERLRQEMETTATAMDTSCDEFLAGQHQKLDTDMTERHRKIALINEVIDLSNATRLACFKSQALNDPKLIREAEANFPKIEEKLEEIVQSVGKTTDLVSEIAAASQEQAQGIDQVNTAVAQMDKVTQQNAANAEESASASEELSAQAESMKEVVGQLVALVGGGGHPAGAVGGTEEDRAPPESQARPQECQVREGDRQGARLGQVG